MSLGFGFALPAYPLRGGGGNNPFNQLGPTLDLSFVDGATNVGDLSNPNGYTLNTNFITPQYQVAAQYVVWETGVGLVDKTFSQIVTFSRTSGATWFNSAGVNVGIDFSISSVAIGTGSKTFTLTATAGVDRSWTAGDIVRISEQATPANFMDGTVTSYTASTQTLVVNVTATGGSGTIASWRVSNWMPRFDYNPATLAAQGLLIEEARTNSIRNNTMQGAVAGTPGTLPTNWVSSISGLTRTVVGTGTSNGINYVDIRLSGTSTGTFAGIYFESVGSIAATNGQTWVPSAWVSVVGGSTANITSAYLQIDQYSNVPAYLASISGPTFLSSLGATFTRFSTALTTTNASTAFVIPTFTILFANGAAIDITLRIGLPQLELGAFATSVIPTTTTALTRNADVASVNTLSPWFNATAGTVYSEFVINSTAPTSGFPTATSFNNGTTNNRINPAYLNDAINALDYFVSDGGVTQVGLSSITYTAGNVAKMAAAYATNDFALSTNGGAVLTDTSGTVPSVTAFNLGNQLGGNYINGYLRRITYYPRRLTNAELQALTA